jgi:hypothetical protein
MRGGGAAAPGSGTAGGRQNFAGKRQTRATRLRLARGLHLRAAEDKANSSGGSGGWLGLWPGHRVLGAGRRPGGARRGDTAAQEQGEKSERRLLTTLQNLGEGTGDGGVVAEDIKLGWPSLGGGGVARSGVGRRGSRHRVLVR